MTLEEIIDVIKTADSENKDIVRLHTGDSSIYGAIREQIEQLNSYVFHGISVPESAVFLPLRQQQDVNIRCLGFRSLDNYKNGRKTPGS